MNIRFGIDELLVTDHSWKKDRIGMVTNEAATTHDLRASRKALLHEGFNLIKLFSPEHGLDVQGADGHFIQDGTDQLTGLPVVSLYSQKLAPSAEDLAGIDVLLFDIPDAGSRFYTYLWTMTHVMEACAAHQKRLIILDRPNPISGNFDLAEGPILEESQASFIGRWAIPIRHSCTMGELARYFAASQQIKLPLEVILCKNWQRKQFQPGWGTRFVPTSPAIQSFESMLLYPGTCLMEATNISEGRGTHNPFTQIGAPWIKADQLAGILFEMGLDDLNIESVQFTPCESKYSGQLCQGIAISAREPTFFQPVFIGLLLIKMVKQLYPNDFSWAPYPTLVNPMGKQHLNKLLGIANSEALFDEPLPKFIAAITRITKCSDWQKMMENYLLYPI
jgi:uncharacterized protein YbbC (DUF1343 family)